MDAGVPSRLVSHYASFLLLHIPEWPFLATVAFGLGLSTRRPAKIAAFSLIIWIPLTAFARSVWSYFTDPGNPSGRALMFGFNVRILPTALTLLFGFAAWALGRRLNRRKPPGPCLRCGYNLTGNTSGICPECGTAIPEHVMKVAACEETGRPN